MFEQISVEKEIFGAGENLLRCGNVMAMPPEIRALYGQACMPDCNWMKSGGCSLRNPRNDAQAAGWKTEQAALWKPALNLPSPGRKKRRDRNAA